MYQPVHRIRYKSGPPFGKSWFNGYKARHHQLNLTKSPEAFCGLVQSNLSCLSTGILHPAWFVVKRKWSAWKTSMYLEHRWNRPSDGTQSFKGSLPERFIASGNNLIQGQNNHYYRWWHCSRRQNTTFYRWYDDLLRGAKPGSKGTVT